MLTQACLHGRPVDDTTTCSVRHFRSFAVGWSGQVWPVYARYGTEMVVHLVHVDPLLGGHAHAERDPARDLAHDRLDAAVGVEVVTRELGQRGLVSAATKELDSTYYGIVRMI